MITCPASACGKSTEIIIPVPESVFVKVGGIPLNSRNGMLYMGFSWQSLLSHMFGLTKLCPNLVGELSYPGVLLALPDPGNLCLCK